MTPESTAARPADRRDRHVYVLWAAGLALLAALGLFCWLLMLPTLQARAAVDKLVHTPGDKFAPAAAAVIRELGGRAQARRKLSVYLRVPGRSEPDRRAVAYLLGLCDPSAVPDLIDLLRDRDSTSRSLAADSLGWLGDPRALAPLNELAADNDPYVQQAVGRALKSIKARTDPAFCRQLARSADPDDQDTALTVTVRHHLQAGASREEVTDLLGRNPALGTGDRMRVLIGNAAHIPSAELLFEEGRLVRWSLTMNGHTVWYPDPEPGK